MVKCLNALYDFLEQFQPLSPLSHESRFLTHLPKYMLEVQQYQNGVLFEFEALKSQFHSVAKKSENIADSPPVCPASLRAMRLWEVFPASWLKE